MDSLKIIVGRIQKRLDALGIKAAEASRASGLSEGAIYNLQRGAKGKIPTKGGNVRTFSRLAPTLRTTLQWLTEGIGPEVVEEHIESSDVPTAAAKFAPIVKGLSQVRLISWVSAGKLANADSQIPIGEAKPLHFWGLGRGEFFGLRVDGDSMDRLSPDSSIIIVNRADRRLVKGKCYVFAVNGEATYKIWQDEPARLEPFSTNPMNKTIFIKRRRDLDVVGRVVRTTLDL